MAPFWNCCFRNPAPDTLPTPIKVRSVHFEPPVSSVDDSQRASHFRFQESDLDEVNSHYEVPNADRRPPNQTLPSPPVLRTTTSCDDDPSQEVSYEHPVPRRKVLKKTRGSGVRARLPSQDQIETISATVDSSSLRDDLIPEEPYAAPFHGDFPEHKNDATDMEEVHFLRLMVHKLNAELGKLQSKVKQQDGPCETDGGFDGKEPPSWSCDVSRVAPLVVAFEEEVNEKNEIIQEYEEELRRFKAYFEEMMQRQEKIFAMGPIDPERHLFLKENAEIVLSENDLLKEKLFTLKKYLTYSEDVLTNKVEELQEEIIEHQKKIHDLEHTNKLLEHDNKRMSKDVDKLSKSLRDMIPLKEHEEVVANFRNTIKKAFESQESELQGISKQKKLLDGENEELRQQVAKLEINLMQVQCENKVYRKMVAKFEDVTMRLKHQLATSIADRDQMRAEIINTNNSNQVRKNKTHSARSSKELKILSRIHQRLLDLKMSAAERDESVLIPEFLSKSENPTT